MGIKSYFSYTYGMRLLNLLIFFLPIIGLSQPDRQSHIFSFEDYTKCMLGFKNLQGDTVWPAQFEIVSQLKGPSGNKIQAPWLVKSNGHYGVLDWKGKEIVSLVYDDLQAASGNYLIARSGDKYGVIFLDDTVHAIPQYESLDCIYTGRYYRFRKNGKAGILDRNFIEVIPPLYDEVQMDIHNNLGRSGRVSGKVFKVVLDGKTGILDTTGRIMLPLGYYSSVAASVNNLFCAMSDLGFTVADPAHRVGVADYKGNWIVPMQYEGIRQFHFSIDSCTQKRIRIAIAEKEGQQYAFNLNNGLKSKAYLSLEPCNELIIFQAKKGWGVLDTNLKEIISGLKYRPDPVYDRRNIARQWNENSEDGSYGFRNLDNGIFYQRKWISGKGRATYLEGIVNVYTHAAIPTTYKHVVRKADGSSCFYWALKDAGEGQKHRVLDIFDRYLVKVKSFELSLQAEDFTMSMFCETGTDSVYFLRNSAQQIGAVSSSGEIVVPFEYMQGQVMPAYLPSSVTVKRQKEKCPATFYLLSNDSLKSLFNNRGKQLITGNCKSISVDMNGYYLVQYDDNKWKLLNYDLHLLLDDCSQLYKNRWDGKTAWPVVFNDYHTRNIGITWFAIRHEKIYVLEKERFKLLDSTTLRFSGNLEVIGGKYLIGKDGTIVESADNIQQLFGGVFAVERKGTLTILNQFGKVTIQQNNYDHYFLKHNFFKVFLKNGDQGIIDQATGRWALKPVYRQIVPDYQSGRFWIVPNHIGTNQKWALIDTSGKLLTSVLLDLPAMPSTTSRRIFRSDNRFGLMDLDGIVLLPAEYENIVELGDIYFYRQLGKWGAFSSQGKITEPLFTAIAVDPFPKGVLVFAGEKAGILSKDLQLILPLTPIDEVQEKTDLLGLLGIEMQKHDLPVSHGGIICYSGTNNKYRQINNKLILDRARVNTTLNQFLEPQFVSDYAGAEIDKIPAVNPIPIQQTFNSYPFYFRNEKYYSVMEIQWSITWDKYIQEGKNTGSSNWSEKWVIRNYKITNGTFTEIVLEDLFVPGAGSTALTDSLLVAYINKYQLFGSVCVDLEQKLLNYKQHFALTDKAIRFYQSFNEADYIEISYTQFKSILKEPVFGL